MSGNDKYDDLDDVLDDFELGDHVLSRPPGHALEKVSLSEAPSTEAVKSKEPVAETPKVTPEHTKATEVPEEDDEKVAEELRKGMSELLEGLDSNPEMRKMFDSLMSESGIVDGIASDKSPKPSKPATFEDTISATVDRLHESRNAPAAADDESGDAFLEQMLRELQGASGSAGEGGAGMDDLLKGLMEELSSKDVLYEPMKELHEKYPAWFEEHKDKISADELTRLKKQQGIVAEIITCFEKSTYSDGNKTSRAFITAKMEEMQETGAPPSELLDDLADGAIPGLGGAGAGGVPDCGMQ